MTLTTCPLIEAIRAVERALVARDVTPVRMSGSSALHGPRAGQEIGDRSPGWTVVHDAWVTTSFDTATGPCGRGG